MMELRELRICIPQICISSMQVRKQVQQVVNVETSAPRDISTPGHQTNGIKMKDLRIILERCDILMRTKHSETSKYEQNQGRVRRLCADLCRKTLKCMVKDNKNELETKNGDVDFDFVSGLTESDSEDTDSETLLSVKKSKPKANKKRSKKSQKIKYFDKNGRLHQCRFCENIFHSAYSVKRHELLHDGVEFKLRSERQRFSCEDCGADFSRKLTLERHLCGPNSVEIIEDEIPLPQMEETITSDDLEPESDPFAIIPVINKSSELAETPTGSPTSDNSTVVMTSTSNSSELIHVNIEDIVRRGRTNTECVAVTVPENTPRLENLTDFLQMDVDDDVSLVMKHDHEIEMNIGKFPTVFEIIPNVMKEEPCGRVATTQFTEPLPESESDSDSEYETQDKEIVQDKSEDFSCRGCGKSFAKKELRYKHEQTHDGQNSFVCNFPLCGKAFSSGRNVENHMKMHSAEAPYKCNTCGKRYRQPHGLLAHVRAHHTGERPYKCDYCEKNFTTLPAKRHHELRHHIKVKPWKCQFCEKRCFIKYQMVLHERTHTGEKPLRCSYCNKCFARPNALAKHQKVHFRNPASKIRRRRGQTKGNEVTVTTTIT